MATITVQPNTGTSGYVADDTGLIEVTVSSGSPITLTTHPGSWLVVNPAPIGGASITLPAGMVADDGTTTVITPQQWVSLPTTYVSGGVTYQFDPTEDDFIGLYVVGRVSDKPDAHSGHLYLTGWHQGAHEIHGLHTAPRSQGRKHQNNHHQERLHFTNCVFELVGGTSSPVLNLRPHVAGNVKQLTLDDQSPVNLPSTNPVIATSGWPGGLAIDAPGSIVLYSLANNTFSAVAAGTDLTTDAYISYVKVGHVSLNPDPHTGNLIFHLYHAGSHQNHGAHNQTNSVGRKHQHPHNHQKKHFHQTVFVVSQSGVTPNAAGFCTISWTGTTLALDDGSVITLPSGPINSCPAGGLLLYNADANGIVINGVTIPSLGMACVSNIPGVDLTGDAYVNVHLIARLSTSTDAHTGQYYLEGWHVGSHQAHGAQHASQSVGRAHSHKHHQSRHHHKDVVFSISNTIGSPGSYSCTVSWTAGELRFDDGTVMTVSASSAVGAQQDQYMAVDFSINSFGFFPGNQNFASDTYVNAAIVARLSSAPDPHTGQLYLHGWHVGSHQLHGKHVANSALAGPHFKVTAGGLMASSQIGPGFSVGSSSVLGTWRPTVPASVFVSVPYLLAGLGHWEVALGTGSSAPASPSSNWSQPINEYLPAGLNYTTGTDNNGHMLQTVLQDGTGSWGLIINSANYDVNGLTIQLYYQLLGFYQGSATSTNGYLFLRLSGVNQT